MKTKLISFAIVSIFLCAQIAEAQNDLLLARFQEIKQQAYLYADSEVKQTLDNTVAYMGSLNEETQEIIVKVVV